MLIVFSITIIISHRNIGPTQEKTSKYATAWLVKHILKINNS